LCLPLNRHKILVPKFLRSQLECVIITAIPDGIVSRQLLHCELEAKYANAMLWHNSHDAMTFSLDLRLPKHAVKLDQVKNLVRYLKRL